MVAVSKMKVTLEESPKRIDNDFVLEYKQPHPYDMTDDLENTPEIGKDELSSPDKITQMGAI